MFVLIDGDEVAVPEPGQLDVPGIVGLVVDRELSADHAGRAHERPTMSVSPPLPIV